MVTEEPRNAEDTSRDYKDLDDTAGSTAPDDLALKGMTIAQVAVLAIRGVPRPAVPAAAASAETHRHEYMT